MATNTVQDIYVKATGGDNITNTIRGERASSTSAPSFAAEHLAAKLFGPALISVARVEGDDNRFVTKWRAEADPVVWASCDETGRIYIEPEIPPSNTDLAHGPHRALKAVIVCRAERFPRKLGDPYAWHGLGVPGVDVARTREAKDQAIAAWLQLHSRGNGKKGSLSCNFSTTVVRAAL